MAEKESDSLKIRLMIYRVIVIGLVAFLLVHFDIVNNTNGLRDAGVWILAVIVSLPITMLLDKYIVKFAEKHKQA
jgi:hypothetical protein